MIGYPGDPSQLASTLSSGAGTLEEAAAELFKISTEITIAHTALSIIFGFIVIFGLFSGFIKERLYVGEAIIATVMGIALGYAAGGFIPRTWGGNFDLVTLEVTRVVIALSVFAVGVELPKAYALRHWRSLSILLGPVMLFGWLISGGLIFALIPGLDFLPALIVAAGVTPTDPILASSVVGKGKYAMEHVPAHIRHLLLAESGSNDGAAFPFLYLALFLYLRGERSVGQTIGSWIALVLLYQIVLGVIIGATVGIVARKVMKFSKRRRLIEKESMVAMYVALSLLVTGITTLCGSDDLLAAFACGTAFAWDDFFQESIDESNFSSIIDLLANCTMFIYLGATMPFSAWTNADLTLTPWRLVVLAICILLIRRIPSIYLLQRFIPDIKTNREALFCGHFGPMGVGAIFISTLATTKLPTPSYPPQSRADILALSIQPITYFIVLSSILVHGLTISTFTVSRRVHSRVQSIARTFTQTGMDNDNEPSWMSRVKRVATGEEIIVNRDDEEEKIDYAGTGGAGGKDEGTLRMFGAPSSSSTAAGSGGSSEEKGGEGEEKTEREMDEDEHPRENVMSEEPEERDSHVDPPIAVLHTQDVGDLSLSAQTLPEENDEEIAEPESPVLIRDFASHSPSSAPSHALPVPNSAAAIARSRSAAQTVEGVVSRAKRRGTLIRDALVAPKDDGLTPEERAMKLREKAKRDAECRKEQHYYDRESGSAPRTPAALPDLKSSPISRSWIEGIHLVTEGPDGEQVKVRSLTPAELESTKEEREGDFHKLLKVASNEIDLVLGRSAKGKSPERSRGGGDLSLRRTERVNVDEDWEEEEEAGPTASTSAAVPAAPIVPHTTIPRPAARRGNSAVRSMRQLLFHRRPSVSPDDRGRRARAPSPERSITFAALERPQRGIRLAPKKEGDLSIERTATGSSIRFLD